VLAAGLIATTLVHGLSARAEPSGTQTAAEIRQLRARIEAQAKELDAQRRLLDSNLRRLEELESRLGTQTPTASRDRRTGTNGAILDQRGAGHGAPAAGGQTAQDTPAGQVGQPSTGETERRPPEVAVIAEQGGVLTPLGSLTLEPKFDYTKSTSNRLTFRGISVVEGFLIGIIEATDADRDSMSASMNARLGVTNRLEIEAEVPYVYRNDRTTSTVTGAAGPFNLTDRVDSHGLGDVEVAGHYQINSGTGGWPFFIANMRYKSTTGRGPFDVDRDSFGVPTELATGSGFHSIEPSLTVLYPTDPAVLFATVGYAWSIGRDVNTRVGSNLIGHVDPGDAIRLSYGLGLAVNERLSLSLGYAHDIIGRTETEVDDSMVVSNSLTSGRLLFGAAYRFTDRISVVLSTEIGATEDAPDARILLRVPIRFDVF
jgi:hypothetical protein